MQGAVLIALPFGGREWVDGHTVKEHRGVQTKLNKALTAAGQGEQATARLRNTASVTPVFISTARVDSLFWGCLEAGCRVEA